MIDVNVGDPAECTVCQQEDKDQPCAACRKEIHESWHSRGWWWIRPEECHEACPGRSLKEI